MAHPDLEALRDVLLPFAKEQLSKHGSFIPFGATMAGEGHIALAMSPEGPEGSTEPELVEVLERVFAAKVRAGGVRAFGLCFDGRVVPPGESEKTDAVCCSLEHSSGQAIEFLLPYRKALFGRIKFGAPFALVVAPRTFASSSAT